MLMTVSKPHARDDQVLAMLTSEAIRHTQPQRQRTVIGDGRHAELATRRLIAATQHEELVAASITPVAEPLPDG